MLIVNPPVPTLSILALMPFHGPARNNPLLLAHQRRLSIAPLDPPLLNYCGYNNSCSNLAYNSLNLQQSSQTILAPII
ncbi:hypothetical protein A2U01_0071543, partial [Trifolium medium]|nr:hypothetical protein [Trifolium medium]